MGEGGGGGGGIPVITSHSREISYPKHIKLSHALHIIPWRITYKNKLFLSTTCSIPAHSLLVQWIWSWPQTQINPAGIDCFQYPSTLSTSPVDMVLAPDPTNSAGIDCFQYLSTLSTSPVDMVSAPDPTNPAEINCFQYPSTLSTSPVDMVLAPDPTNPAGIDRF